MNILIVLGHPRKDSFSAALADAYKEGALSVSLNVRQINLADFNFNPNLVTVSPRHQAAEELVSQAQERSSSGPIISFSSILLGGDLCRPY